jgi:membrane-associated phospholipid phosphatase
VVSPGATAGRAYQRVRSVSVEVVVVMLGVVTYFGIRGMTNTNVERAVDHAHDIVALERRLWLDHEDWLQDLVVPSEAMSTVFNWIYIWGHWPVIVVTLLWLALRHRTAYLRLRNAMMISGGLGLLVYTTYPVAPPRLAHLGLVDTVTERSQAYRVLQPPAFVNQYAAMPSLHVGWDLLVGITIVSVASAAWLRMVGRLMPVLMALATVATANHYVLDVLAGAALALVGLAAALFIERRREATRPQPPPDPPEAGVPEADPPEAGVPEPRRPAAEEQVPERHPHARSCSR